MAKQSPNPLLYWGTAFLTKIRHTNQVRNAETVIVTGADHFFTKQIDAVEETMRNWAREIIEAKKG